MIGLKADSEHYRCVQTRWVDRPVSWETTQTTKSETQTSFSVGHCLANQDVVLTDGDITCSSSVPGVPGHAQPSTVVSGQSSRFRYVEQVLAHRLNFLYTCVPEQRTATAHASSPQFHWPSVQSLSTHANERSS